jgi:hypothetical protein
MAPKVWKRQNIFSQQQWGRVFSDEFTWQNAEHAFGARVALGLTLDHVIRKSGPL